MEQEHLPKVEKEAGGYWKGELEIRYEKGRNDDRILTQFQCKFFHFRNIKVRSPEGVNKKYQTLLLTMNRALLDAFWIRYPGTIWWNMSMLSKMVGVAKG